MSHFSSALEQALSDLGILKQDFAKTIGVGRGVVSSYTGALIPIGAKTAARVCAALPMPQQGRVLKGYLLDQIPDGMSDRIRVEVQISEAGNPRELPEMDDELSDAFQYLIGRAIKENVFRALVVDLHQATSAEFLGAEAGETFDVEVEQDDPAPPSPGVKTPDTRRK